MIRRFYPKRSLALVWRSKKRRKCIFHTTFFHWMLLGHHSPSCSLRRLKLPWLLSGTSCLAWPSSFEQQRQKGGDLNILDWLWEMFGFQKDVVRNQREHDSNACK